MECYDCYKEIKGKTYYAKRGGGDGVRSFGDAELKPICLKCKLEIIIFKLCLFFVIPALLIGLIVFINLKKG